MDRASSMHSGHQRRVNLIAASIYDEYSIGASIRPICTKCCCIILNMTQVSINFHLTREFVTHTRPDEIVMRGKCRLSVDILAHSVEVPGVSSSVSHGLVSSIPRDRK